MPPSLNKQHRHYSRVWCICSVYPSALWVIGWTELQRSAQKVPQLCPEVTGELGVPVTNHLMNNIKKPHYLVKEELGTLWGTKSTLPQETKSQVNVFSKAITTFEYRIEARHNGNEVIKPMLQDWNHPEGTGKGYSNLGVAYILIFCF